MDAGGPEPPAAVPVLIVPDTRDEPLPRRMLVFAIVSIGLFMSAVDQTIVSTGLPSIDKDLGGGVQWSGWVITAYALGEVLIMPLAGKISDMYGRKRVFLAAAVVFTTASLLCGIATSIPMLIAIRVLQAIGGGAFMPPASGLVSDHFGRRRDKALGMFTSIFPIGGVVGPVLGGIVVTFWSWRGIFFVNVPVGIALIVLGAVFFPRSRHGGAERLDLYGVVVLGAAIACTMLGISYLGSPGASPLGVLFVAPVAVGVAAGWLFVRHARRDADSFISVRLLAGSGFGTLNILNFVFGANALGFAALVPLYAQERFGIPVLASGTLLTARAIGMILVAALAVAALRRTGYRIPMIAGYVLVVCGMVMLALVPAGVDVYAWLSLGACVTGLGMGMSMPAANNAIMHLAPEQVAGVSGLRGMFRQSGGIAAVSVATAIAVRSADPGAALGGAFFVFACIIAACIPLILRVPDHRGAW
jgi:EmrB/QacA subfamily drug resistance transporter